MGNSISVIAAAAKSNPVELKRLIDSGVDPTAADSWGWTPLHYAALGNQPDSIKHLAAVSGIHVNAVSSYSLVATSYLTPLQIAARDRHIVGPRMTAPLETIQLYHTLCHLSLSSAFCQCPDCIAWNSG